MSIDDLIQAAAYIERRERGLPTAADTEHGYASTAPLPDDSRRSRSKKALGSRSTHNELEKNRRAHLRQCLEQLKEMVPLGPEASRHTTLGLLTRAKRFIKSLEDKERKNAGQKETLQRHNRYLRRRLESLNQIHVSSSAAAAHALLTKRRSVSESSSTTFYSLSTNSSASPSRSESDEVDVIGYSSNQSDSDDHSSVQSSSDSGVVMSTSRLSLSELVSRNSI